MSSPIAKSVKKLASRSSSRHSSAAPSSRKRVVAGKATRLKPATKRSPAGKARARKAAKVRTAKPRPKSAVTASKRQGAKAASKLRKPAKAARPVAVSRPKKIVTHTRAKPGTTRPPVVFKKPVPSLPPPQPTHDEAAALHAFEAAHKEFTRGEYVAAQELFERALRREPEAAHIHYGLAASRARLGAIDTALKSLRRALDLQPNLRIRAQRDQDLNPLRSDPEFDQLVFAARD